MKEAYVLLGPPPVVTIMPAAPALRTGVIQVIVVLFTTLREVADNPPNVTEVAPVKFLPVIVTFVPPAMPPDDGEMPVISGGVIKVKDKNATLVPYSVLTITPAAPLLRRGVIQVIVVLFTTLREVAGNPLNDTKVASVKDVPVIVTLVPPDVLPVNGKMLLITGGVI